MFGQLDDLVLGQHGNCLAHHGLATAVSNAIDISKDGIFLHDCGNARNDRRVRIGPATILPVATLTHLQHTADISESESAKKQ